jgi:hypothetical protein
MIRSLAVVLALLPLGDTFTYVNEDGDSATISAKLVGEGQGAFALELPSGELKLIPQGAVQRRVPSDDPEPETPEAALERLKRRFAAEKFRGTVQSPYVIGLILSEPLEKQYEVRAGGFLKKAAKFFKTVEGVFLEFMKDVKASTVKPRYPLTIIIFETDGDFEEYAHADTEGRGLSAGNIAGYYNVLSNQLVIRMSECHTFETPLHEAIHMQVYNRGVLQRLAPLPAWFNEGLAAGFEANGERINIGPFRVSMRYSRQAMQARNVDWDDVVVDDTAFRGDVLAGEAYGHAWSIHWFLASKYRKQYVRYLELLGRKKPLEQVDAEERRKEFEETFGKSPGRLQKEFPAVLEAAARKQKINLYETKPLGYSQTTSNLAEVEMTAIRDENKGGLLEVEGRIRNLSTIRPMSFHVTVETEAGAYADWFVPSLGTLKTAPLPRQFVQKLMENAPGGPSRSFRVRVKAAVPDGETGQRWQQGSLPKPIFGQ